MSGIVFAYCVELDEVVSAAEARRASLSAEPPGRKFTFFCAESACRVANVRVTGVAYRTAAQEATKYVAPHFRRSDKHLPNCCWEVEDDPNPLPTETEEQFRRRQARRKLSDFVDVFDPRPDAEASGGPRDKKDAEGNRSSTADSKAGNGTDVEGSQTRTAVLDRLVDSYLEAKSELSTDEFRNLSIRVIGLGEISISKYFIPIRFAKLDMPPNRVLFGGGTFVKWYGDGFRLKFFDKQNGVPIFLYVSNESLRNYKYGNYLKNVVRQHEESRYLSVYAVGELRKNENGSVVNLEVSDLKQLTIHLGPPKKTDEVQPISASISSAK